MTSRTFDFQCLDKRRGCSSFTESQIKSHAKIGRFPPLKDAERAVNGSKSLFPSYDYFHLELGAASSVLINEREPSET